MSDGTEQPQLPLNLPPGGTVRLAVGSSSGPRSSTWRVWTSKNADDVYVAARSTAGVMKASLHESGSWQYGFINGPKAVAWVQDRGSRHLDLWQKPPEFGPGFTRAYMIAVPYSELRPWPESPREKGAVAFLPPPGIGEVVQIEIVLIRPTNPPVTLSVEHGLAVARLAFHGGDAVGVIARLLPWAPGSVESFKTYKASALAAADPARVAAAGMPRLALYGLDTDGTRMVIDAAAN